MNVTMVSNEGLGNGPNYTRTSGAATIQLEQLQERDLTERGPMAATMTYEAPMSMTKTGRD